MISPVHLRRLCAALALAPLLAGPPRTMAHESPIDHINRTIRFEIAENKLIVDYRIRLTPRAAILQLRAMDRDRDGTVFPDHGFPANGDPEYTSYFKALGARLANDLVLKDGDRRVAFAQQGNVALYPDLSNEYRFEADLGRLRSGVHTFMLRDNFSRRHPGSVRVRTATPKENQGVLLAVRKSPEFERLGKHAEMLEMIIEIIVEERDGSS